MLSPVYFYNSICCNCLRLAHSLLIYFANIQRVLTQRAQNNSIYLLFINKEQNRFIFDSNISPFFYRGVLQLII